jgi:hypothetical protein
MHTAAGAGRKGRGRPAAAAAAAASGGIDVEAQQEVTVALSQKLPALLTQFQAEPAVVSDAQHGPCASYMSMHRAGM